MALSCMLFKHCLLLVWNIEQSILTTLPSFSVLIVSIAASMFCKVLACESLALDSQLHNLWAGQEPTCKCFRTTGSF